LSSAAGPQEANTVAGTRKRADGDARCIDHVVGLDRLAAAAEAGALDTDEYLQQFFASKDDLNGFVDLLNENGEIW
jgi:hypothetical protein